MVHPYTNNSYSFDALLFTGLLSVRCSSEEDKSGITSSGSLIIPKIILLTSSLISPYFQGDLTIFDKVLLLHLESTFKNKCTLRENIIVYTKSHNYSCLKYQDCQLFKGLIKTYGPMDRTGLFYL